MFCLVLNLFLLSSMSIRFMYWLGFLCPLRDFPVWINYPSSPNLYCCCSLLNKNFKTKGKKKERGEQTEKTFSVQLLFYLLEL